jgi:putative AlgH/UPF0301 family transcriptional regulator
LTPLPAGWDDPVDGSDPLTDTVTSNTRCGLLVASPSMVDVNFSNAVVLLCDYDEDGALGIVINRPIDTDIGSVLDQLKIPSSGGIPGRCS